MKNVQKIAKEILAIKSKVSQEIKDTYSNFRKELEHRIFLPYGFVSGKIIEDCILFEVGPIRAYFEPEPLKPTKDINGVKVGGIRIPSTEIKKNFKLNDYQKAIDAIIPVLKADIKKKFK